MFEGANFPKSLDEQLFEDSKVFVYKKSDRHNDILFNVSPRVANFIQDGNSVKMNVLTADGKESHLKLSGVGLLSFCKL